MFELPDKGDPWEVSPLVNDASGVVRQSSSSPARQAVERGEVACAVRLPGFQGLLRRFTQPGVTFSREMADRVRVIACPTGLHFMTHSESEDGGVSQVGWAELARGLGADTADAIVVVWLPREDAATAAREVLIRASAALDGIPSETRQAYADGTTGFERILPGPDRMYPDTDTPPLPITDVMHAEVQAQEAETPWDRQARYECLGLDRRMARALSIAPWRDLFDEIAPEEGESSRRLAGTLEKRLPHHMRRNQDARPHLSRKFPEAARLAPLVRALEQKEIQPDALAWAVDAVLDDPDRPVEEVLARFRPHSGDEERLREIVREVAAGAKALDGKPREAVLRWAMGLVMREFRSRVDPREAKQRLDGALAEEVKS